MFENGLQWGGHCLREKGEGIGEIALARAVLTDEKGRIVEFHLLRRKAAETLHYQPAEDGFGHGNGYRGTASSMASRSRFSSQPRGYRADSALASRRKPGPRSCSAPISDRRAFAWPLDWSSMAW